MSDLKYYVIGLIASVGLLVLYFSTMIIATDSVTTTVNQFRDMWYWLVSLSIGFGIQTGLFVKIRSILKGSTKTAAGLTSASGSTSGISMVACCAHHLAEILPALGISGIAIFLTNYQIPLIILGLVMNMGGIAYMLRIKYKIT